MYSPKIEPIQVRKLFFLKMSLRTIGINKPMTKIVRDALDEFIPRKANEILNSNGTLANPEVLMENVEWHPRKK